MRVVHILLIGLTLTASVAWGGEHDRFVWSKRAEQGTPELARLLNLEGEHKRPRVELQLQMMTEAARTLGFQAGVQWRGKALLDELTSKSHQLDATFAMAPLIRTNGTLPPVIEEARDLASFSHDQVRLAHRAYNIAREERFVSVPPTWRDYLLVGLNVKAASRSQDAGIYPATDREKAAWQAGIKAGWAEGVDQADSILVANFNRLTRDMTGMILYSSLYQQGMITATTVAESIQTASGTSTRLVLGDRHRRVTGRAAFKVNPDSWRSTVRSSRQSVDQTKGSAEGPTP